MHHQSAEVVPTWRLGRGPLIFHGAPPLCVGEIELINDSDKRILVRSIAASPKGDTASRAGLTQLRVNARVEPNQRTRARAYFQVDRLMPPGTYAVDLAIGGRTEHAVVHVWQKANLTIDPRIIQLRSSGGETLKAVVIISNEGNVTESCREVALAYLEEHEWLGRAQVYAMRKTRKDEGILAYLDHLIEELKTTMPGEVEVKLRTEIPELRPGETREVELDITLPNDLHKNRTYYGFAPFMGTELKFKVECTSAGNSTSRRPQ